MDGATAPLLRAPILSWLWGARIQRIDAPAPLLFVLTLYQQRQKTHLLLGLGAGHTGIGTSAERPQGLPASGFVRRLRVLLENGLIERISGLGANAAVEAPSIEIVGARREAQVRLVADFEAPHPNLLLLGEDDRILGALDEGSRRVRFGGGGYRLPRGGAISIPGDEAAAARAGVELVRERAQHTEEGQRRQARGQVKAALKRAERKRAAIAGDLARAEAAPQLRREGDLLLCHLAAIPRGASEVSLNDLEGVASDPIRISLDPSLSAQQNAERKFARARRLARGLSIARERLDAVDRELAALQDFLIGLDTLALATLSARAVGLGLVPPLPAQAPPRRMQAKAVHVPYRVFEGSAGARILVGKGAADNDTLTLQVARPHDWWLHARNLHGAHVLLQRTRDQQVPPEALLDAAHLAAHFSDARGERLVEIQHTERRYVRKLKGAPAGSVRLDKERTLLLRVEPERLQRLLAHERTSQG